MTDQRPSTLNMPNVPGPNQRHAVLYIGRLGFSLLKIAPGTKGPITPGWQRAENAVRDVESAKREWASDRDGLGLLHSASGTLALDIDREEDAVMAFAALGIDLRALVKRAPYRIRGKNGEKPLYLAPPGSSYKTLKLRWPDPTGQGAPLVVFELRGDGAQDVLPPTIHPDTQRPYEWAGSKGMPRSRNDIPLLDPELQRVWDDWEQLKPLLEAACPWAKPRVEYTRPTPLASAPVTQGSVSTSARRYAERTLEGLCADLSVTGPGGRNDALNKAAYKVGQHIAAGGLDQGDASAQLLQAARASGLSESESLASLRSGLAAGKQQPFPYEERLTRVGASALPESSEVRAAAPQGPILPDLPDVGDVVVVPHNLRSDVTAALRLPQAEAMTVRTTEELSEEYLTGLRRDQRSMYVVRPPPQLQQTLNRAGVVWDAIDLPEAAEPEALLANLLGQVDGLLERQVQGDREYLLKDFPELLNRRASGQQVIYPTGFPPLDAALGGGFYPGLHVLGGVTAGGKTAMALHIAESNARAGRPVIFVTYEQSRAELWTRLLSPALGIGVSTFRAGRTTEGPLGQRLQEDARYQDIADTVAPHLRVYEGDAADRSQQWGIDRLSGEIARLKAFYDGRPPLVILDYLQRMPPEADADKRHQIDSLVMALQVRLGRQLETPILLLSSVSRGNYGELLTTPLEERLGVFKESGGIEYTAYSATLLYPFAIKDATGYEVPPVPGSPTAALKGLWRYIVADLVKNREGEAGFQLLLKWWPKQARYEVVGSIDPQEFSSSDGRSRKSTR